MAPGQLSALLLGTVAASVAADPWLPSAPVLVTGATGRTGALAYVKLRAKGVPVRALVRNATKARQLLGCHACDVSEGIFLGDVTQPETLLPAMRGAGALVIATGAEATCTLGLFNCKYRVGAAPRDINWLGTKAQVEAFAREGGRHAVLLSTMDTTVPDNFLDKLGQGHVTFYSLQGEAFLMASGIDFTIVKPCGLSDGAGQKHKLLVGHDDAGFSLLLNHEVTRADVARVLAAAVLAPGIARNLRFDLCSSAFGSPQEDLEQAVFKEAMYPWDPRRAKSEEVVV